MTQPLAGKQILIVEDEAIFSTLLVSWLVSLGAKTAVAEDGLQALDKLSIITPDLLICDLKMPHMNGLQLLERMRQQGVQVPVLVISATENMADIAHVLRLGVQDVLLKPVKDVKRLQERVFACLYPSVFTLRQQEECRLLSDWQQLASNPDAAARLLRELQPPVRQQICQCRVCYRQLVPADKMGLVLDIAPLSSQDLAFYCLDVTCAGANGVLAALLLRTLFNGLLQEHLSCQRLPELGLLLNQVNQLLHQANLFGQFPLLVGYYHCGLKKLILVSAGLSASLNIGNQHIILNRGVPLGTLDSAYLNQIIQTGDAWRCQINSTCGSLQLMLSAL